MWIHRIDETIKRPIRREEEKWVGYLKQKIIQDRQQYKLYTVFKFAFNSSMQILSIYHLCQSTLRFILGDWPSVSTSISNHIRVANDLHFYYVLCFAPRRNKQLEYTSKKVFFLMEVWYFENMFNSSRRTCSIYNIPLVLKSKMLLNFMYRSLLSNTKGPLYHIFIRANSPTH